MQGRLGAQYCEDPYFGGSTDCCFNLESGTCAPCSRTDGLLTSDDGTSTCRPSSELACVQTHILECGGRLSLGDTMWQRRQTCVVPIASAVRPRRGYWAAAYDFVLAGSFQTIRARAGVAGLPACAALCEDDANCSAVSYDPVDGLCLLQQGALEEVCDPVNSRCTKDGALFYVRDTEEVGLCSISWTILYLRAIYSRLLSPSPSLQLSLSFSGSLSSSSSLPLQKLTVHRGIRSTAANRLSSAHAAGISWIVWSEPLAPPAAIHPPIPVSLLT